MRARPIIIGLATFAVCACLPADRGESTGSAGPAARRAEQRSTAPPALDPDLLARRTFRQAPALDADVAAGRLPPVSERLPEKPLAVRPIEEIGRYGGTLRSALSGDISQWPGIMKAMSENLLAFNRPLGERIEPNLAESWEMDPDGRAMTVRLRKGVCWSDGYPFTADDVLFFFDDMLFDENARASDRPTLPPEYLANGKPIAVEKIDDHTLRFSAPISMGRLPETLAGADLLAYPRHVLARWHPRYTSGATYADFQARTTRAQLLMSSDVPTLTAWYATEWVRGQRVVFARNPYYWKVDTAGQQLPYTDRLTFSIIADAQVILLKFMNGEIDVYGRYAGFNMYPTLRADEPRGRYDLHLSGPVAGPAFYLNWDVPRPALREAFRDLRVRVALSLAINRDEIGQLLYHGLFEPSGYAFLPGTESYNREDYMRYVGFEPDSARALLEAAGYVDADGDGWRELRDGSRFELTIDVSGSTNTSDICELMADYWGNIGIKVNIFVALRDIIWPRRFNGEFEVHHWGLEGPDDPLARLSDWAITGPNTPFWHREAWRDTTEWLHEASRLMLLAQATPDTAARRAYLLEAQHLHSVNAAVIVAGSTYRPWGANVRIGNVPDDINMSGLHGAWARPVFHEQLFIRSGKGK